MKKFHCYFFFVGWDCISIGLHTCVSLPNIEIHVPFGFFRIGFEKTIGKKPFNAESVEWRIFGIHSW